MAASGLLHISGHCAAASGVREGVSRSGVGRNGAERVALQCTDNRAVRDEAAAAAAASAAP
jgi:hypothetical protein